MSLQLYNTLTQKKEPFKPLHPPAVGLYACGPTVYLYAHLGNLRSYIFEDVLKRVLLWNKYKVKHVMNITDVGHLTSDADTGEDKMLLGAKREKKTVWEIAEYYTKAFKEDLRKLNILPPTLYCKATGHIKEQIQLIQKLEKKGYTYFRGGNVYFDSSKLSDYGKLAQLDLQAEAEVKTRARVEKDQNKKNPHDFVLWFTKSKFQEQEMKWRSPWGPAGYPGWHIECSAMAMKYLGEQFDIHCGGIDHIPVHHTNEIAQAEAAIGKKPWVKYWLHNEFLVLAEGKRMGKSEGNILTVAELERQGFHPLDYRYFCLGTHYRMPLMFSYEAMSGAKNARKRLRGFIVSAQERSQKAAGETKYKFRKELTANLHFINFQQEINDDLNTPKALAVMWEVVRNAFIEDYQRLILLREFDKVLGLSLFERRKEKIPAEIIKLAKERLKARLNKDWKKADELRQKIRERGYGVDDTPEGYEITKS